MLPLSKLNFLFSNFNIQNTQNKYENHSMLENPQEDKMVFEQSELESAVLDNFSVIFEGQRVPIFPIEKQTDQAEVSLIELEQLLSNSPISFKEDEFETKVCSPYSFIELEEALQNLPTGKASGYDDIPNELLRQSSHKARLYLQTFLNKIIEDGEVPQDLNVGKCMLIFKVRLSKPPPPKKKTKKKN